GGVFFFSSRRRHTRSDRDWSSDVCSSDLSEECNCFAMRAAARHLSQSYDRFLASSGLRTTQFSILARLKRRGPLTINALAEDMRSEERRVGKECGALLSP